MEVYGLNLNTIGWEIEGHQMIIGSLFDLEEVLHRADEYCYCCAAYLPHCQVCPFNSPSIKGCSLELMELLNIVAELDD